MKLKKFKGFSRVLAAMLFVVFSVFTFTGCFPFFGGGGYKGGGGSDAGNYSGEDPEVEPMAIEDIVHVSSIKALYNKDKLEVVDQALLYQMYERVAKIILAGLGSTYGFGNNEVSLLKTWGRDADGVDQGWTEEDKWSTYIMDPGPRKVLDDQLFWYYLKYYDKGTYYTLTHQAGDTKKNIDEQSVINPDKNNNVQYKATDKLVKGGRSYDPEYIVSLPFRQSGANKGGFIAINAIDSKGTSPKDPLDPSGSQTPPAEEVLGVLTTPTPQVIIELVKEDEEDPGYYVRRFLESKDTVKTGTYGAIFEDNWAWSQFVHEYFKDYTYTSKAEYFLGYRTVDLEGKLDEARTNKTWGNLAPKLITQIAKIVSGTNPNTVEPFTDEFANFKHYVNNINHIGFTSENLTNLKKYIANFIIGEEAYEADKKKAGGDAKLHDTYFEFYTDAFKTDKQRYYFDTNLDGMLDDRAVKVDPTYKNYEGFIETIMHAVKAFLTERNDGTANSVYYGGDTYLWVEAGTASVMEDFDYGFYPNNFKEGEMKFRGTKYGSGIMGIFDKQYSLDVNYPKPKIGELLNVPYATEIEFNEMMQPIERGTGGLAKDYTAMGTNVPTVAAIPTDVDAYQLLWDPLLMDYMYWHGGKFNKEQWSDTDQREDDDPNRQYFKRDDLGIDRTNPSQGLERYTGEIRQYTMFEKVASGREEYFNWVSKKLETSYQCYLPKRKYLAFALELDPRDGDVAYFQAFMPKIGGVSPEVLETYTRQEYFYLTDSYQELLEYPYIMDAIYNGSEGFAQTKLLQNNIVANSYFRKCADSDKEVYKIDRLPFDTVLWNTMGLFKSTDETAKMKTGIVVSNDDFKKAQTLNPVQTPGSLLTTFNVNRIKDVFMISFAQVEPHEKYDGFSFVGIDSTFSFSKVLYQPENGDNVPPQDGDGTPTWEFG